MKEQGRESRLGHRVKVGALWSLAGTGTVQVLSFLMGVVLARILAPADFGIIAGCMVFIEIGSTLVASSFVSTLVRRKEVQALDLSTAFVLQLTTAVVAAGAIAGLSPVVSRLLNNETVTPVLTLLSVNLIVLAFRGMPTVIARRELNFRVLTFAAVVETATFGVTAIAMALAGFGVWSLVAGRLLSRIVATVQLILATGWVPSLRLARTHVGALFNTSAQFAGKETLADLARNTAYFIVGARLGVEALGYYARAHYLMTLPVTQLSEAVSQVLFPAFAKIQDDRPRLQRGFIKSTCLLSLTIFPILIGLQLIAPAFIPLVYGTKWTPTVVPLQIVAFAGLFYAVDPPAVSLINAKGYLLQDIKRQFVHVAVLTGAVLLGSMHGLAGVAAGVVVAAATYWVLVLRLLRHAFGLPIGGYLKALVPAGVACSGMAAVVLGYQQAVAMYTTPNGVVSLGGTIVIGAAIYVLALWQFRRKSRWAVFNESFDELRNIMVAILRRTVKRQDQLRSGWQ